MLYTIVNRGSRSGVHATHVVLPQVFARLERFLFLSVVGLLLFHADVALPFYFCWFGWRECEEGRGWLVGWLVGLGGGGFDPVDWGR